MSKKAYPIVWASALLLALVTVAAAALIIWPFVAPYDVNAEIATTRTGLSASNGDSSPQKLQGPHGAAALYIQAFQAVPRHRCGDPIPRQPRTLIVREENWNRLQLWAEARASVREYENALVLAQAAARQPFQGFQSKDQATNEARRANLSSARELVRAACTRAMLRTRDGNTAGAVQDIKLSLHCLDTMRSYGSLDAFTSSVAALRLVCATIQGCLRHAPAADLECRDIYDMLGRVDLRKDFANALNGERARTVSEFAEMEKSDAPWLPSDGPESKQGLMIHIAAGGRFQRIMMHQDMRFYLCEMATQIRLAHLPYRQIKMRKLHDDPTLGAPGYAFVSRQKLPMVTQALPVREMGMTAKSATRTLLALETYRSRFGAYPPTLEALRSGLKWRIEVDPFSGRDFNYRPTRSGCVLYSIGPNLKDDAGESEHRDGTGYRDCGGIKQRESWQQEGDMVWQVQRA